MLRSDRGGILASRPKLRRDVSAIRTPRNEVRVGVLAGWDGRHRYRAREAQGAEREALWERANDRYAGYDDYQERAVARRIPVIVIDCVY
jgi:F420H(2)-dependent quinone reductase